MDCKTSETFSQTLVGFGHNGSATASALLWWLQSKLPENYQYNNATFYHTYENKLRSKFLHFQGRKLSVCLNILDQTSDNF